MYRLEQDLVFCIQDMDGPGGVHHNPQFTLMENQVVTCIPKSLDYSRIHGSESVGHVISIREPEEIEGGIVLLEVALVEDEKLREGRLLFTYCNIDTRKAGILGGGFIFTAADGYRHGCHAENQQCTLFHKEYVKERNCPTKIILCGTIVNGTEWFIRPFRRNRAR